MKKMQMAVLAAVMAILGALPAWATPTFTITQPEFDYVQLGTYFSVILTALAALWLGRKFIKTTNRS